MRGNCARLGQEDSGQEDFGQEDWGRVKVVDLPNVHCVRRIPNRQTLTAFSRQRGVCMLSSSGGMALFPSGRGVEAQ